MAQVEALNAIGYSQISETNTEGALIQIKPHKPSSAPRRGANTDKTQIFVEFDEVIDDGGSQIISYSLEMDDGTGFISVSGEAGEDLTRTRQVTQDIVSGQSFDFRYRAQNIFGWSEYSDVVTIIASSVPSQPLNVATTNNESTTTVTISWDIPNESGGDGILIDAYLIQIYDYS